MAFETEVDPHLPAVAYEVGLRLVLFNCFSFVQYGFLLMDASGRFAVD